MITIIIPSCQAAKSLPATLASCFAQTYQEYEVIVVDDGSTDETPQLIEQYLDRVSYLRLENGGVSRARNLGAVQAQGEWLLFLDADDQLLPHALAVLLKAAQEQQAGVAYGMVIERQAPSLLPRLNGFSYAVGASPRGAERQFWRSAIITPGSALVRRSLHQQIGGFVTGYEPMEDRDYWLKAGMLSSIAFCNTVLLDKGWAPGSHGSQHAKRIYRGQLAQRALRRWGEEQRLRIDWIPSDKEILEHAIEEAIWRRLPALFDDLLQEAKGITPLRWRWLAAKIWFQLFSSSKNKEDVFRDYFPQKPPYIATK